MFKITDIVRKFIAKRQDAINEKNRKRLTNHTPTLICSNCTGGFLYHWLGLQFQSPFINLYMDNDDFLTAMEHFDEFIATPLTEDTNSEKPYPVGIGIHGVKVHFMHYPDFISAIEKWEERKQRIDRHNMAIMLTNLNTDAQRMPLTVQRFNALPFKNKLIITGVKIAAPNVVTLKGYGQVQHKGIYATSRITGQRYIDQFDYVGYINHLTD